MKILSRDFTTREKVLLLILVLIIMVLAYYQFVYVPTQTALASARAESEALRIELTAVRSRVARLTEMRDDLESISASGKDSVMSSYNNSKAEITLLNDILKNATQYSVSFSGITRNSDQIRREFSLQFVTADYPSMERIISALTQSEYRCLVGDVRCTKDAQSATGGMIVSATATFYETMVGGTVDAGLPEDLDKPRT